MLRVVPMRPSVSVVLLTYSRPVMLRQTLTSVLAQRDVDLEVVLVDNGSSPPAAATVAETADPRVAVVRLEENIHPIEAQRRGLQAASGDWVAYLDDDDLWAPDKLAVQLAAADHAGAAWAYAGVAIVDEGLRVLAVPPPQPVADVVATLPYHYPIEGGDSNVVARREVLTSFGGHDPDLRWFADWDLALQLLRHGGTPARADEPVVAFRLHGGNESRSAENFIADARRIAAKHADLREPGRDVDMAAVHELVGGYHRRSGAWAAAARHYVAAVRGGRRSAAPALALALLPRPVQRAVAEALRRRRNDPARLDAAARWLAVFR